MGGVPVAVAVSVPAVLAWVFGVGATALLIELAPPGTAAWVLRLAVAVGAPLIALRLTRRLLPPLRRLFPDNRSPSRPTAYDHAA
ncbi:hypothetical protein [Streptomyces sp. NPDC051665]|uniref:hypothetical protein n=1 Tax=Streptomyces sp. NPDC051665 TaxID=3154647 RepID=UPI00341B4D04